MTTKNNDAEIRKSFRINKKLNNRIQNYLHSSDAVMNESEVLRQAISLGLTQLEEATR